jgi:GT2 family glycosyltransferase
MTDKKFPKIFVIILNFNGIKTLADCLSSVFQSDYPNFEVIVVDNDSKDESFEQARTQFSRAHFIKNSSNVGFSKGNNVGIRYALEKFADYVFILNNDAIIKKATLSTLEKCMQENPSSGIVSPIIFNNENNVWFAGGKINWNKMKTSHIVKPLPNESYPSEYLSGCAMLIKKEVFKKVGLFDERFFLYYEDADFSLRAKNAGFELLVTSSADIIHLEQSENNKVSKSYWLVLSGLIFFKTHASFSQKIWLSIFLSLRKIKNFYNILHSNNTCAIEVKKAYTDFKKIY